MDQENKKTHAAAKKEPAAPEKKEPEKNNIQELIDKAKAKGTLTNTEILAALGVQKGVLRLPGEQPYAMYYSLEKDSRLPARFDIPLD